MESLGINLRNAIDIGKIKTIILLDKDDNDDSNSNRTS